MTTTLEKALEHAEKLYDRGEIEHAIARMGREIDVALAGEGAVLVTIMTGALVFAAQLALAIRSELTLDYVHVARYRDNHAGALRWLRRPDHDLRGQNVVLADDILDEGETLKAVRAACLEMGARRVLIATLTTKLHDRRVPGIASDFNGVDLPDRFVVGYGMDYDGYGRNLPAIYALRQVGAG